MTDVLHPGQRVRLHAPSSILRLRSDLGTPLTPEIARALSWPGGRADVPCCGGPECLEKVRRAGAVVHEWPTDPEATAVVRRVEG